MVLIGLIWIPVIQGGKGLYDYLQGVQAYLAPPIFVVFFLGVSFRRLNGLGCLAALDHALPDTRLLAAVDALRGVQVPRNGSRGVRQGGSRDHRRIRCCRTCGDCQLTA
jgi:hypothetical protein